jgi:hypothetical protein
MTRGGNVTLAINTITTEGIVLAADSRQSYRNLKGMARIGSDNASKLVQVNERIAVAIAGVAFLLEDDVPKNIKNFIDQFKREAKDLSKLNVKDVALQLHLTLGEKYKWQEQLKVLPERIRLDLERQGCEVLELKEDKHVIKYRFKDPQGVVRQSIAGIDPITVLVAGFNDDGNHESYTCSIPGDVKKNKDGKQKGIEYGASWIGQTDVVTRIVLGFDPRVENLEFVGESFAKIGLEATYNQLKNLEYSIQWGTMTLQDAIDFSILMIETTSAIQRFSDGIMADPGDMPGVGGNVDVAVITLDKNFVWVNKKKLKACDSEIDIY